MPSEIGKLHDNEYRFPGERSGLPLQAGEVAWSGEKKASGWWLVLAGVVVVLAAITVGMV